MYLARFLPGQSPRLFWESQYAPLASLPPDLIRQIYAGSAAHVRAGAWLPHEGSILDAGCGPGLLALTASEPGRRIVGVDCSPGLLDLARRLAPDATFTLGTLEALPVDDGRFDAYVAISSLEFSPTGLVPALAEARRVLRPGGRLLAICLRAPLAVITGRATRADHTSGTFDLEHRTTLADPFPDDAYGYFYRSHELARAARDAGLAHVRVSRADLLGGLAFSGLSIERVRAPILEWMGARALARDGRRRDRLVDDALLRERGLGFTAVAPVARALRHVCSYWNVLEAVKM
ncbi:class I SAM-dependent methyltransferase [Myxococcota bacterium]|nr:class I SAM-dependent methyltransferase [Myxococcota bacterium]